MLKIAVISVINNSTLGHTFYAYALSFVTLVPEMPGDRG